MVSQAAWAVCACSIPSGVSNGSATEPTGIANTRDVCWDDRWSHARKQMPVRTVLVCDGETYSRPQVITPSPFCIAHWFLHS